MRSFSHGGVSMITIISNRSLVIFSFDRRVTNLWILNGNLSLSHRIGGNPELSRESTNANR